MSTLRTSLAVVWLFGIALVVAGAQDASAIENRPNIVLIVSDDQGYHDVGFHGVEDFRTPNIDSLALNGIRFTNGYVTGSVCAPTRAGLLTGRYQQRFGFDNLPTADPNSGLPVGEITLAELLRNAGYRTAIVGKWHLGTNTQFHPNVRGFEYFFGFLGAQHVYNNWGAPMNPIQRNGVPLTGTEYLTFAFTREAVSFIERSAAEPFFLYLAYNAVHTPLNTPPPEYFDRFANIPDLVRRRYAAAASAMDDGIGQVMDTLRRLGLEENTLVFFHSDNGGPLTPVSITGRSGASNSPLRGEKNTFYEGGIRVPFVVQWQGHLAGGTSYDHPVNSLDIFPTALAAAGVQPPGDRAYDGVNLLPYLSGDVVDPPHQMLFWRQQGGEDFAVRDLRYKLVRHNNGTVQLFDLQADVSETTDIIRSRRAEYARLLDAFFRWNSQMIPPLWGAGGEG